MIIATLDPMGRLRQRRVDISLLDRYLAIDVMTELRMDQRRSSLQGILRFHEHRQRLQIDDHQLGGVLGDISTLGHDDGNRLANEADVVERQ